MRKKRIIISIVAVACVLAVVFFVMRFDVIGRIYKAVNKLVAENKVEAEEEAPEEFRYETLHDEDGEEVLVEYKKQIGTDLETGEEVEMWVDAAKPTIVYVNAYKGKIEKIKDNKIYFIVDKEYKGFTIFWRDLKDVKDYEIVFDIDTYDLREDAFYDGEYSVCDNFCFNHKNFYSADELEFLVGEYLIAQDAMFEDYYIGDRYKTLGFNFN